MISTPINSIINTSVVWTPIPSSITFTISSQSALGGVGLEFTSLPIYNQIVAMGGPGANTSNPVPVAAGLKGGVTGTAYSETITAQGGAGSYTFSSPGPLPTGLSMNSSGVISGTPSTVGTFPFTVNVTDANGFVGSQSFTIIIAAPGGGGGGGSFTFLG
jgi:large repetitive protein